MTHSLYKVSIVAVILLFPACGQDETNHRVVGTLEWDRVELIAEASEPIVEITAQEGDWVEPGQVLVRLDPARQQARLEAAKAGAIAPLPGSRNWNGDLGPSAFERLEPVSKGQMRFMR